MFFRFAPRFKRENVELSPQDILTLLSLWEEDKMRDRAPYRPSVLDRYEQDFDDDNNRIDDDDDDDDNWVEGPVFPGRHYQVRTFYSEII